MSWKNEFEKAGLKTKVILAGKMRPYFSFKNFTDVFKIIGGFIQSLWLLFWIMPDAVFCKGGYVGLAPSLVAKLYLIPIFAHESDSVPGKVNRIIGKMSKKVFISFQSSDKYFKAEKIILTGNPVREELLFLTEKSVAAQNFNLSSEIPTILVLGGSQGAQRINNFILESLVRIVSKYQVIHQTGENNYKEVSGVVDKTKKEGEGEYADNIENRYKAFAFLDQDNLRMAYSLADLVISRAGAGGIFEISALGKPSIIIPLTESANDHQEKNALEFSKFGAVILHEGNLTPNILLNQIEDLVQPEKIKEKSEQAKGFIKNNATDMIAKEVINIIAK